MLAIPVKRFDRQLVQPLSVSEAQAILSATDPLTQSGRRDHLLWSFLYHTGARLSEALRLRQQDISWGPPTTACLQGKGRKQRGLPLLKPIAQELKEALARSPHQPAARVFQKRFGQPLTRWGVARRSRRTVQQAARPCVSLKGRRFSPHTFRRATPMRLFQADVDIMVFAPLLGHESPTITYHYIELDLQMKERCLRKIQSPKIRTHRFKPTDRLLQFLESL